MTNARDLRKFNRKKQIVTNNRGTYGGYSAFGQSSYNQTRSTTPGARTINPRPMAPCPPGTQPCGWSWTEQPGVGSRTQQCCDIMKRQNRWR